jgi:hypothetical protein
MPKPLIAIALVSVLAALPVYAQRGGGRGGGFAARSGGGASAHASPGAAFGSHPAFMAAQHFSGFDGGARPGEPSPAARSFNRGYGPPRDDRYRRPYSRAYPLVVPYAVGGWIGPGYGDSGFYDDSSVAGPPAADYAGDPQNLGPEPPLPQDQPEAQGQPAPIYRPAYVRPQAEPDPVADTPVTLIFKDGRPSEQIHNYMLTRTMLYVQDEHRRRIPVDQLDMEATAKANQDSGIDFRLPVAVGDSRAVN